MKRQPCRRSTYSPRRRRRLEALAGERPAALVAERRQVGDGDGVLQPGELAQDHGAVAPRAGERHVQVIAAGARRRDRLSWPERGSRSDPVAKTALLALELPPASSRSSSRQPCQSTSRLTTVALQPAGSRVGRDAAAVGRGLLARAGRTRARGRARAGGARGSRARGPCRRRAAPRAAPRRARRPRDPDPTWPRPAASRARRCGACPRAARRARRRRRRALRAASWALRCPRADGRLFSTPSAAKSSSRYQSS